MAAFAAALPRPPLWAPHAVLPAPAARLPYGDGSLVGANVPWATLTLLIVALASQGARRARSRYRPSRHGHFWLAAKRSDAVETAEGAGLGSPKASEEVLDTVVVGAGLSGLTCAYALLRDKPNTSVVLTESQSSYGGNICTRTRNGRLWEEGPNSFQPDDAFLTLACELGLADDILLADPGAYRFVWWDGRLRPLPMSLREAIFGDFLSLPGKIWAALGFVGFKKSMPSREESVQEFVTRNLGKEVFERLVDPFVSGVYAGDSSALSAEAAFGRVHALEKRGGSLLIGALRRSQRKESTPRDARLPDIKGQTVGTFRSGMMQLADGLASHCQKKGVTVRLRWKLCSMFYDRERSQHILDYDTPNGPRRLRSRSVVLTAPSGIAAKLLRPLSGTCADALDEIPYPPVALVTLEYSRSAFREPEHGKGIANGFGQLHPRSQGMRTLGIIYPGALFPGRMPDPNRVLLANFIGGARDHELFGGIDNMTEAELVEAVHKDIVKTLLKPSAKDTIPEVLGVKVWSRSIPQPTVGHIQRLELARSSLNKAGVRGIYLAGNYVGGVSLGSCVKYGMEVAKQVGDFISPADLKGVDQKATTRDSNTSVCTSVS